jgi:hypothetical protein
LCFYIYAPNKSIEIRYASETVVLLKDGTSIVTTDILVSNNSLESIDKLVIIYPNNFYKVIKSLPILTGSYSDDTNTLLDNNHSHNWVYSLPGTQIQKTPTGQLNYESPSWGQYLEIFQPDPSDSLKNISFDGIVGGKNELVIDESFTPLEAKILSHIRFNIFKCSFEQPVEKGVPRWLRLSFHGECCAHNIIGKNSLKILCEKITNTLHYEYQIFGPYDVLNRFILYLTSYKKRSDDSNSLVLKTSINNILDKLKNEGLIGSDINRKAITKFNQIFLHINPAKLGRLTDPNKDGDVAISGLLPNSVALPSGEHITVYEWKSIPSEDKNFKFSILFQTKPLMFLYVLLPWIAILISIFSLWYSLTHKNNEINNPPKNREVKIQSVR